MASSGMFTASGPNQASIQTSSGIVAGGPVTAPAFNGAFYGNGAGLTNVGASNVGAANVSSGTFGAGVLLPAAQIAPGPVTATSGTFTASGPTQPSIQTSSGIVAGGPVTAPAFSGTHYGDGSNLTGVSASNVAAPNVTPGTFGAGVILPAAQIAPGPVTATSGTFTASGPNQASIATSSGINSGGPVVAPAFSGAFYGNGAGLNGISVPGAAYVAQPNTFTQTQTWAANLQVSVLPISWDINPYGYSGSCLPSTTINLTTNGGYIQVWFSGLLYGWGSPGLTNVTFLMDGSVIPAHPPGYHLSAGAQGMGSWTYTFKPAAGAHSFCLSGNNNSNVPTILCASYNCEFGARDLQ
jgi:hypothetical protein